MMPVDNRDEVFKPEYIFPQFLLNRIVSIGNFDLVKFPSTKVDLSRLFNISPYNYVIPVDFIYPEGFCRSLTGKFSLTYPSGFAFPSFLDKFLVRNENVLEGYLRPEDVMQYVNKNINYFFEFIESHLLSMSVYQIPNLPHPSNRDEVISRIRNKLK